ncbi:hypothetical protein D3C71_1359030 [compost metagenome]
MAVAAGEIVQARPGRNHVVVRAVVVAAAVVQIPVQGGRRVAFAVQPLLEGDGVQRSPRGVFRRQHKRNAKDLAAVVAHLGMQAVDQRQEAMVLRHVRIGQARHGQQAVFPMAVAQQAFLRRMHQDGLVVIRADVARATFDDAEVGQHLAHVGGRHRRQRQVMRAQRIVQFVALPARRVAGEFRPLHHDEIGEPFARQLPGAGQAGHPRAQDHHLMPIAGRGRGQRGAVAQRMPGLHAGIGHVSRGLDDARPGVAGRARHRRRGRAQKKAAAAHQRMTLRQSSSK